MRATQYLIEAFQKEGLSHIFMVPGGLVDHFYTDLTSSSAIKPIVAAHEAGAVFMADGYARASGLFGAALVIGGPGTTNTITALAAAWTDRSPIFLISGEVPTLWEGLGGFQDASPGSWNDITLLSNVTLMSQEVERIELLSPYFRKALAHMKTVRSGPVHLSLPVDVQTADHAFPPFESIQYHSRTIDLTQLPLVKQKLAEACSRSDGNGKIAILIGAGVEASDASEELLELSERYLIPVATTLRAKGSFPEDHPFSLGVFGYAGHRPAIETILSGELELLLVIGSGLNQRDTLFWNQQLRSCKTLIQVDSDPTQLVNLYKSDLAMVGDAKLFLKALLESGEHEAPLEETKKCRHDWLTSLDRLPHYYDFENCSSDATPIHPARAISEFHLQFPQSGMVLVDSGAHRAFCGHYWQSYHPRTYLSATNLGPMGWAIPAGIGAALARPDLACAVFTGDGCMQMHGMEIQTAARYKVPIIYFVINNSALGNVYLRAKEMGSEQAALTEIPTHDWAKFAEALGAKGRRVTRPEELKEAIAWALAQKSTVVLDVLCGRDYSTPVSPYSKSKQQWHDNE